MDGMGSRYLQNPIRTCRRYRTLLEYSKAPSGFLLLYNGASVVDVKDQMEHSSIQVTVGTYVVSHGDHL
jgi:hypothetical protein